MKNRLNHRIILFGMVLSMFLTHSICSFAQCTYGNQEKVTGAGTSFLLCFEQNESIYEPYDSLDNANYVFLVALQDTAHVTITCREFPAFKKEITLQPYASTSYKISDDVPTFLLTNEEVDNHVVQIVSTAPIYCYGMDNRDNDIADAFSGVSSNIAGSEYMIMSYSSWSQAYNYDKYSSQFSVAAFEDNTKISIVPSVDTKNASIAGSPISFTLDKGQCVQIKAAFDPKKCLDLTGSTIIGSKPVAVFSGHKFTPIYLFPHTYANYLTGNHLAETIPPISTWGQSFAFSAMAPNDTFDIVRVLALNDSTHVLVNGIEWGNPLMKGTYRDTQILGVNMINCSGPCLVADFGHDPIGFFDDTIGHDTVGNGSFALIPPLEQTYTEASFYMYTDTARIVRSVNDSSFAFRYVMLISERSNKDKITIDGKLIRSSEFKDVPGMARGKQYSVANIRLANGGHRIVTSGTSDDGFVAIAYGKGYKSGHQTTEWANGGSCYSYAVAGLFQPLRGIAASITPPIPAAPGTGIKRDPTALFHNILNTSVYLDSAVILVNNDTKKYQVGMKEVIWSDIGHLKVGEEGTLHLTVTPDPQERITGKIRIYHHTFDWRDLEPVDVPFVIEPQQTAGVNKNTSVDFHCNVFPNPVFLPGTIHVNISGNSNHLTIELLDQLGRVIIKPEVRDGISSSQEIKLQTLMSSGVYYLLISSDTKNQTIPISIMK